MMQGAMSSPRLDKERHINTEIIIQIYYQNNCIFLQFINDEQYRFNHVI